MEIVCFALVAYFGFTSKAENDNAINAKHGSMSHTISKPLPIQINILRIFHISDRKRNRNVNQISCKAEKKHIVRSANLAPQWSCKDPSKPRIQ